MTNGGCGVAASSASSACCCCSGRERDWPDSKPPLSLLLLLLGTRGGDADNPMVEQQTSLTTEWVGMTRLMITPISQFRPIPAKNSPTTSLLLKLSRLLAV